MMHGREKVGPRHSSCGSPRTKRRTPAVEQSAAEPATAGAGGAKGGDQGKCGPAKHVPGAEPGKACHKALDRIRKVAKERKKEKLTALFPSHQYRPARRGILTNSRRMPRRV